MPTFYVSLVFGVLYRKYIIKGIEIRLVKISATGCAHWIPFKLNKEFNKNNTGIKINPERNKARIDAVVDFLILWYSIFVVTDIGKNITPIEAVISANLPIFITGDIKGRIYSQKLT